MTKILLFFLYLGIVSCNPTQENHTQDDSAKNKADIAKLNDVLKKYEEPSQITQVSAQKPSIVTGKKGTKISINPNDLITESGKPLGQTIDVELKELTNQGQLLRTNAQTVSDGKLLVSGGAYFIGMTSNGEQLKLKQGKTLKVQFPKLSNQEMTLFYGQRNEIGQMNWQKAPETFKFTQKPIYTKDSVVREKKKEKSEMKALLDYMDSGDTTTTQEEREIIVKKQKNDKANRKVYDEIGLANLGWINCDRFLDIEENTDLLISFNPQDSIQNAQIYLVFKDINSVTSTSYHPKKLSKFERLPIGYKVRLIAYSLKNEKVFAYSSDLTIAKEQKLTLSLKEFSDQELKELLNNKE
ncbi:MAG: hypothetical protein MUC49_19540 [Raineya sp.]|jgi:hypothetical protein|nr:hypothetical protein [Raineya sp.]